MSYLISMAMSFATYIVSTHLLTATDVQMNVMRQATEDNRARITQELRNMKLRGDEINRLKAAYEEKLKTSQKARDAKKPVDPPK